MAASLTGHWAFRTLRARVAFGARAAFVVPLLAACGLRAEESPSTVVVTGAQRTRYESLSPQFRSGLDSRDEALALRTNVALRAAFGRFGFTGEIMDSRLELNDRGSPPNTSSVDALEPVQAFAQVAFARPAGGSGVLRVGRMTLDVGKRRLVARNAYRNTVNSFAGLDWQWRGARGSAVQAFYLRPMRILPSDAEGVLANEQELDRTARGARLVGGLGRVGVIGGRDRLEGYALRFTNAGGVELDTAGARIFRDAERGAWLYEAEAVLQRGRSVGAVGGAQRPGLRHRASLLHAELGYVFPAPRSPALRLTYDRATGDRDPLDARNERFDTLSGARRFDFGPTGIYGPFARANLETAGLRLTLNAAARARAMIDYRTVRLASATDAWTTTGLRDLSGRSGRSLGRQLEASVTWDAMPSRLTVETGFALFRKGRFAEQAPGANGLGDPFYFHAALTTRFGRER